MPYLGARTFLSNSSEEDIYSSVIDPVRTREPFGLVHGLPFLLRRKRNKKIEKIRNLSEPDAAVPRRTNVFIQIIPPKRQEDIYYSVIYPDQTRGCSVRCTDCINFLLRRKNEKIAHS